MSDSALAKITVAADEGCGTPRPHSGNRWAARGEEQWQRIGRTYPIYIGVQAWGAVKGQSSVGRELVVAAWQGHSETRHDTPYAPSGGEDGRIHQQKLRCGRPASRPIRNKPIGFKANDIESFVRFQGH